ncbi:3-dehydroquinate dehydratase [Hyphomicrobiales bacterium]|nr:3-dehydroquinate dehydratase [Hyphomicrobiales bacterium]CAH1693696.1 3-dehydroquinate dehydratase [Hyphomicrobiales bacterium]
MIEIAVIVGPNMNLLGKREPEKYGSVTLAEIEANLHRRAEGRATVLFRQSNAEADLIDWIQEAGLKRQPIILHAGAYTHTSVALRDAILGSDAQVVEVGLTNVHGREAFRQQTFIKGVCVGSIGGFGAFSYELALEAAIWLAHRT